MKSWSRTLCIPIEPPVTITADDFMTI